MSMETLQRVYGHHHPDYQREAAENIGRRPQNVRVISGGFRCVPLLFAPEKPGNTLVSGEPQFSEGRGHRFESCRVRQSFNEIAKKSRIV